ncbi:MAG: ABC transporter permease subunit [Chloroflexota bacterium]|nr:ABC transporter permease subunit [Chloroflexota bacterium]MDE2886112.1 ABC transporter permease subunit [Chloroflexota bacterium]
MAVTTRNRTIPGTRLRLELSYVIMAGIIGFLGLFLIYPIILLLINSFNTAPEFFVPPRQWGLDNWRVALDTPGLVQSFFNTIMIWGLVLMVSFPTAVLIAWTLARTNVPMTHLLEFMFWVSFMMPGIATTIGWIMLADPDIGIVNTLLEKLPFIDEGPLNIFSVPGLVFAHLMANGISVKVMLLTPTFRNMDSALEEAGRVSGAGTIRTMFRVTLPLMAAPMTLVLALQLLRIFQSFEIEQLLGVPFKFFVYSTKIFQLARDEPPLYGEATVLASLTLVTLAFIIPIQRWILHRQRYTTISGSFRPGLINLGPWRWVVFGAIAALILALTVVPAFILGLGSFMTRVGFFNLNNVYTLRHWDLVLTDPIFIKALRTTFTIAIVAAFLSPLVFSVVAYVLVRTRWFGRGILDLIIWGSGAVPGILTGLGLLQVFLGTPVLTFLFGTIWALLIVVVLQGNTLTTNISKAAFVQIGQDMEEAARVSGAGWIRTYFRVWIPLLMPTLVLLGTFNFVLAAGATSQIILLASRDTMTLSIMALELVNPLSGEREAAGIVAIFMIGMTVGVASVARYFGNRMSVSHHRQATAQTQSIPQAQTGGMRI